MSLKIYQENLTQKYIKKISKKHQENIKKYQENVTLNI